MIWLKPSPHPPASAAHAAALATPSPEGIPGSFPALPCRLLLCFLALWLAFAPPGAASGSDTTAVVVMATTDMHGRVIPWNYYSDEPQEDVGLTKIATLVDSVRSVHEHTLLLDAGDWLQGNPMAEYFALVDTAGAYPLLQAVDAMRYDALVLGNHEFNFGVDLLNRRIVQHETPILGANIYHHGTEEPAYLPYLLREVDGLTVGIIGLTTPGSAVWDRHHVEGRLDFADGVDAVTRFVEEVRDRGADVVIVLAHSGLEGATSYQLDGVGEENFGRAIAERVPGVDLLVLGHTHRLVLEDVAGPDGQPVPVIQAGRWADHLALAELTVVREDNGDVHLAGHTLRAHAVEDVPADRDIHNLVADAHADVRAYVNEPLAETGEPWATEEARRRPTAAIDLIHHVQLQESGAQLSAAAAFSTSVTLGPGAITRGEIAQLYPYENTLYTLSVTGAQLRAFLEYTSQYYLQPDAEEAFPDTNPEWPGYNFDMLAGVDYVLDLRNPVGERVTEMMYQGEPVQDDDRFTLAVNSYRASGGGGFDMLAEAPVLEHYDRSVREMIIEFLRSSDRLEKEDVSISTWRLLPAPPAESE